MSGCLHNVLYLKDERMDVVTEQVWVTVSASRAHVLWCGVHPRVLRPTLDMYDYVNTGGVRNKRAALVAPN